MMNKRPAVGFLQLTLTWWNFRCNCPLSLPVVTGSFQRPTKYGENGRIPTGSPIVLQITLPQAVQPAEQSPRCASPNLQDRVQRFS